MIMEVFMSDDINNLDPNDEGLKGIFGDRFQDATSAATTAPAVGTVKKPASKTMDAQWEPVQHAPSWMDSLKGCAKSVMLFGGLSVLVFYWQQAGLMAESIAVPSMCVCTALAGLGVGKNIRGDM
jgi:hypothetical protein